MTTTDRAQRTLDWYTARFEREYRDAQEEYVRLRELFKDVCWYNFEVTCRTWRTPWRESEPDSHVELCGMRFHRAWNRGRLMEHGSFPMWYEGPVRDAPALPPQIVLNEIKAAREYMVACEKQLTAPKDWAPGGDLYEELRRTTLVGVPLQSQCVYTSRKRKFSGSEV